MLLENTNADGVCCFPLPMYSCYFLQVGNVQLVQLMAQVLGTTVDPSEMADLEGESQGLSQMATQDN